MIWLTRYVDGVSQSGYCWVGRMDRLDQVTMPLTKPESMSDWDLLHKLMFCVLLGAVSGT